jgi:hypothetical protein
VQNWEKLAVGTLIDALAQLVDIVLKREPWSADKPDLDCDFGD